MKHWTVMLALLAASAPALTQEKQDSACWKKAMTQVAMDECAGKDAARADTELNDVYRKLLSEVASQPEAVAKIKASERAWIAYRDSYMEAMYPAKDKQLEYGSRYPMDFALLKATLTYQHVSALKQLLRQYNHAPR